MRCLLVLGLAVVPLPSGTTFAQEEGTEPAPAVPASDPEVADPPPLTACMKNLEHPRLLFAAADLPGLRRFASGAGRQFFTRLVSYARGRFAPPGNVRFLTNATEAQREGLWRLPSVSLHYLLTRDGGSLAKAVEFLERLVELEHWETTRETDSGMSAGNLLAGAALAYDWLHDALEPEFRERLRRKLLWQARALYYYGHLERHGSVAFWQKDPQNNHRWHRDAGLTLAVLAAYSGKPEEHWILQKTYEELAFVHRWLPEDGTSHEGPLYLVFGGAHLTLAAQAADRCFGTEYLRAPFFANTARFRVHSLTPDLGGLFHYGDGGGLGMYNNFFFKAASVHGLRDVQAALELLWERHPEAFDQAWLSLVWFDPALEKGSLEDVSRVAFYEDLGLAFLRDRWDRRAVGAMFKCSPIGGHKLNRYRNEHGYSYINVAHDDPDANSFLLWRDGHMLAETNRYSDRKLTSSHNTLLVNGEGQLAEGARWTQPLTREHRDMSSMARVTGWRATPDATLIEGEAGGAYAALERYRRTFVWVTDGYVLVLDEVRAPEEVELTWLLQGPRLEKVAGEGERYELRKNAARCPVEIIGEAPVSATIGTSTADDKGRPLGWQQLRVTSRATRTRLVTALNPWNHDRLEVRFEPTAPEAATITVRADGFADTWKWRVAADNDSPSSLEGARRGGFEIRLAPPPDAARR